MRREYLRADTPIVNHVLRCAQAFSTYQIVDDGKNRYRSHPPCDALGTSGGSGATSEETLNQASQTGTVKKHHI